MALVFGLATLWFWCLGLVVTVRWLAARVRRAVPVLPGLPSVRRARRVR